MANPPALYPLSGASTQLSRRTFIAGTASFAAAVMWSSSRLLGAVSAAPKFSAYPFQLGVASGDPLPDGVVLWTRLAPRPLETGGGMMPEPVEVSWQIAEDEAMSKVVQKGTATANAAWAHSVHVEVSGLKADRWYWYQFKAGSEVSPKGRTRTAPPPDAKPSNLNFAFVSCQKYETGYYNAYEHMAREELDLIVHLGDYIYEKGPTKDSVRPHSGPEIFSVDDYRNRYAQYKSDPALQAAHAMAPWIVTWDDHEVSNNYASDIPEHPDQISRELFMLRRAAGYQAYFEHMPLRRSAQPKGPYCLLYRQLSYGQLASFHVLDTRQYRTDQPYGDGSHAPGPELMDPKGTMMGAKQRDWLFNGLESSKAGWNVIAQQVMMARQDSKAGPEVAYSMDKWSGYEYERRKVLREFHDKKIVNPVVIAGDIHSNWANNLIADFDDLDSKLVAPEFVGTSITSGGDGSEKPAWQAQMLTENPFVKFHNDERGYVKCQVTSQQWKTEYKTVPFVTRKGAPLNTRATFIVESGRPELNRA